MEALLTFVEQMPSWQKLAWIFICLSFNWIGEAIRPLFNFSYNKVKHIGVNMVFLASDVILNLLFSLATVGVFAWMQTNQFGLLNWIDLPLVVELLIAIMVLDLFAQYGVHYFLHRIPILWRFHMIHHSDNYVDATTATRHHPGDYIMRELFALVAILITGIPLAYYLFYRLLTVFFGYFTHSNITMPKQLDKLLSYVFVTPTMHKFHHHFERPWTDTNFGNIFSFWDRMFGTMVYDDDSKVVYGLDMLDDSKHEDILYQFYIPFNPEIKTDSDKNFLGFKTGDKN